MGAVVGDEDLLFVIHNDTVWKLEMFRAAEFLEDVAILIEDQHSHHFAFDHDDATLVIDSYPWKSNRRRVRNRNPL